MTFPRCAGGSMARPAIRKKNSELIGTPDRITTLLPRHEAAGSLNGRRLGVRSKDLALEKYDTDKITNRYLEWYDPHLVNLVDREVRLLEIGVKNGGSLLLWRDYLPKSTVAGIDLRLPTALPKDDR